MKRNLFDELNEGFIALKSILYGNNDADSAADFSIQLTGVNYLAAADFVL